MPSKYMQTCRRDTSTHLGRFLRRASLCRVSFGHQPTVTRWRRRVVRSSRTVLTVRRCIGRHNRMLMPIVTGTGCGRGHLLLLLCGGQVLQRRTARFDKLETGPAASATRCCLHTVTIRHILLTGFLDITLPGTVRFDRACARRCCHAAGHVDAKRTIHDCIWACV